VRSDVAVKVFGDDLDVMLREAKKIAALSSQGSGRRRRQGRTGHGSPGAHDRRRSKRALLATASTCPTCRLSSRRPLAASMPVRCSRATAGSISCSACPTQFGRSRSAREPAHSPASIRMRAPEARSGTTAGSPARGSVRPARGCRQDRLEEGPNQVSHENGKRRVVVQANVRGRDLGGFVADAQKRIDAEVKLPAGYWTVVGRPVREPDRGARAPGARGAPGAWPDLWAALSVVRAPQERALIFTGVPLALTGGILALAAPRTADSRSRRPSASSRSPALRCSTVW
jgi:cobalt-zinc-cadmium resistance protein CzcA